MNRLRVELEPFDCTPSAPICVPSKSLLPHHVKLFGWALNVNEQTLTSLALRLCLPLPPYEQVFFPLSAEALGPPPRGILTRASRLTVRLILPAGFWLVWAQAHGPGGGGVVEASIAVVRLLEQTEVPAERETCACQRTAAPVDWTLVSNTLRIYFTQS